MTDDEFEKYIAKRHPKFEGNRDHLKALIDNGILSVEEETDYSDYSRGPAGKITAVASPINPIDEFPWNKWRKQNPELKLDLAKANLSMKNGAYLPFQNFDNANLSQVSLEDTYAQCASFKNATFYHANLKRANFRKVNFENANLRGADMSDAEFAYANFQNADLSFANLSNANLRFANLKNAKLIEANFDGAEIGFVKYNRGTQCRAIYIETSKDNAEFKRFAQDQDFIEEYKRSHKYLYWIWKISSDCGRSISLWALWSLLFALFFGGVYYFLGKEAFHITKLPWSLETMMYYSFVTFTTLGLGDVYPATQTAARLVIFEVVVGYIMLGGLISIFATKLARRS
jgi:hypothetical protein